MTEPDAVATSRAPTYAVVVPTWGLAALAAALVATLAALSIVERGGLVFALLLSALAVAVLIAPAVSLLERGMPRGAAVAIVVVLGIVALVSVLGTIAWDLNRQSRDLSSALHSAIDDLPPDSTAASVAESLELADRVDRVVDGAAARIVIGDTDPIAVAGQVGQFILIAVLGAFVLTQGRSVLASAIAQVRRASTREQLHGAFGDAFGRGGAFLRRTMAASIAHGAVAGVVAGACGLPGAVTLGTWVAVVSTVPIVGGVAAWAPLVALATVNDGSWQAVAFAGIVAIVVHGLLRRRWVHAALHVGPFLTLLGIGVGWSLDGVRGAVVGLLGAGAFAAVFARDLDLGDAVTDLVEDPEPHPSAGTVAVEPMSGMAVVAEARSERRMIRLNVSARTIVAGSALAVTLWTASHVIDNSKSLPIWLAIGSFIAIGLDRPIGYLERRLHVPRLGGIAVVLGAMFAVVISVGVLGGPSITDSAASIVRDAPETVRSLESLPIIGDVIRDHDASKNLETWIRELPDRISESSAVDRVINAAGDGLVGAVWTFSILLAVLVDGPRLVDHTRRRIPVHERMRWTKFGRAAHRALANVAAASAFVAALNGSIVMLLALALGIPLAPVLGLWAMGWNFIPQIGGFVAAVPLVALGFGQGTAPGLIAFGVFITYQTFENHVIQPFVGSKAVRLPPLVVLSGALAAGALAGFVGALMAGPVLGVVKVAMNELRQGEHVRVENRPATKLGAALRRRSVAAEDPGPVVDSRV